MVYMMQAGVRGPVKIGYVKGERQQVDRRRRELQCGCPQELAVLAVAPGGPEIEALLHWFFSPCHIGGEWFLLDAQTLASHRAPDEPMGDSDLIGWIANAMLYRAGSDLYAPWPVPMA
jgi:hypothetical protein